MKMLLWALCIMLPLMYSPVPAKEVPKTKLVCDAKQKCKTVRVHKKLTGTKVPQQDKKKK